MRSGALKIIIAKLKWYIFDKTSSVVDFIFYKLALFPDKRLLSIKRNKKTIIFVGEFLPPRIPRLAKWLKRSGDYNTILICSKHGFIEKFNDESIDLTLLFRNKWHLLRLLREVPDIYLIHGFAPKSKFPGVALKYVKAPYIHDMQDVLVTYYGLNPSLPWLKRELPEEKFCLANADGIVAQSPEPWFGLKQYNIHPHPKNIFF